MQSTTNYSMNLVEGTDIVNIPVQLNPNFQTIDGAMFDNKQASVGTATEVVTGTAHAIVRNNPDSDVFRFTATGAWTAGDTMSVDGNAVTVHLSDGTVPPTGAYIIGAEVLAVLNSSLVTLMIGMTPPAQGVTSFNSRTGAVVPTAGDYVAGDIDYDNTGSGLTATEVQSAIDEIAPVFTNPSVISADVTGIPASGNLSGLIPTGYIPVGGVVTTTGSVSDPSKAYTALIGGLNGNYYCILQMLGGAGTQVATALDTVVRMAFVKSV